jgi:hypothetical protein
VSAAENFNLPRATLMAISEREIALSARMFSVFYKMAVVRLVSRSGDSTAKIRATVFKSKRT